MLSNIILTLDEYLTQVCNIVPKGLVEQCINAGKTTPCRYVGTGNYEPLDLEENISYHRVLSQTGISQIDSPTIGCSEWMTKTYNMRYVVSFPKNILGSTEDNPYICDKLANTFANILESADLKFIRADIKAGVIQTNDVNFNTNAREVFNAECAGGDFSTFPLDRCLVWVDYQVIVSADTTCLQNFTCGDEPAKSLIQICIDNASCAAIINAINNAIPAGKTDCIRKGISNGFMYTINFDAGSRVVDFIVAEYEGIIDTLVDTTNVASIEYRVNDVVQAIPFQVNIGDLIQVTISIGTAGTAQVILKASEFDAQAETETVTPNALLNGRGLKTILDASMGVTLNYQLQTGNFDCNTSSKVINGGSVLPNVLNDEFETFITLHFTSGDFTTVIANVNSATQLLLNDFPSDTENNVTFSISFVAVVADQSGQGNNFIQVIPTLQPRYKYNISAGYPYITYGNLTTSASRYLEIPKILIESNYSIYCAGYSLEAFTTSGTNSMWGTFVSGGLIFGENTSSGVYGIELNMLNFGLAILPAKAVVPTSTLRNNYKLITNIISFAPILGVNNTTTLLRIGGVDLLTATGIVASAHVTKFNIGARGFGIAGGSWNMRAFAIYDVAHTPKEYQEIENYITTQYSI